jgi:hypothetical protein
MSGREQYFDVKIAELQLFPILQIYNVRKRTERMRQHGSREEFQGFIYAGCVVAVTVSQQNVPGINFAAGLDCVFDYPDIPARINQRGVTRSGMIQQVGEIGIQSPDFELLNNYFRSFHFKSRN